MSLSKDMREKVGEPNTTFDDLLFNDWHVSLYVSISELLVLNSSCISKFAQVV